VLRDLLEREELGGADAAAAPPSAPTRSAWTMARNASRMARTSGASLAALADRPFMARRSTVLLS
jgi:hypothetical protein